MIVLITPAAKYKLQLLKDALKAFTFLHFI